MGVISWLNSFVLARNLSQNSLPPLALPLDSLATRQRGRMGTGLHGHAAVPLLSVLHGPWRDVWRGERAGGDFVLAAPSGNVEWRDWQGQADHQRGYAGERGMGQVGRENP